MSKRLLIIFRTYYTLELKYLDILFEPCEPVRLSGEVFVYPFCDKETSTFWV